MKLLALQCLAFVEVEEVKTWRRNIGSANSRSISTNEPCGVGSFVKMS
jgi:hypothetical protein